MKYVERKYICRFDDIERCDYALHLDKDEASNIFLSETEVYRCFRRSGSAFESVTSNRYVPRQEIDQWLRENAGWREGEIWSCDRTYYPGEELPVLPAIGRGSEWIKAGLTCKEDFLDYGWSVQNSFEKGYRVRLCFTKAEPAPLFRLLFL